MLVEQLLNLGRFTKASLDALVLRYLGVNMSKEPRNTFQEYGQKFQPYQLEYAANDVVVLDMIRELQWPKIQQEALENVSDLEFNFLKPMCEMELNGISLDVDKWRIIMSDIDDDKKEAGKAVEDTLTAAEDQLTMFGVSAVNIDSPSQLMKSLKKYGLELESTGEAELKRYKGIPVIDALLNYRKTNKLISTYGEPIIEKIHEVTNRLHTDFRQMVSTGRMSSSKPNLQNIPKKQKFRSCFVAKEGYVLITSDMSGAELRILGNLSKDPIFIDSYANGIDLHTKTASGVFNVPMDEVTKDQRGAAKAVGFGIVYGMSKYGLARRLKISEPAAQKIITGYLNTYKHVKQFLAESGRNAVRNRYSRSISGRKRYYNLPEYGHSDYNKARGSVERQGKNAPIQGSLIFNSNIKGLGKIGKYVNKTVSLETGFGKDVASGVYSGEKEVYNLKAFNGISLGVTLNHKIPVCTTTGITDKAVEDIELETDMLMIPLNKTDGKTTNLSGYKYKKGHCRETYIEYKCPKEMSADLAFVIGCLIGDGSYTKHNHFRFVCVEYQKELFDKFNKTIFKLFNYKPVVRILSKGRKTNLFMSQVSSVKIRGFLKHIGLGYVVHRNKSIPDYFYTETFINKCALLNGLFSTDGGVTKVSGPNYTTVSESLANGIHQLLFSVGINSNLKNYNEDGSNVYRIQIPKRFNYEFKNNIGFSIFSKQKALGDSVSKYGDSSVVPEFIPKMIETAIRNSDVYNSLSYNDKAHLRQFKLGKCSFTSWRKFFDMMPPGSARTKLLSFLKYDFCIAKTLEYRGCEDTYDLMCENKHYFIANGVIVHNSNADTIKESMNLVVERLEKSGLDAKLLLTVHDEIIIEAREDLKHEVSTIVEQSLIDGFGKYFSLIPMETAALSGPCWLKGECGNKINGKECGHTEMVFVPDDKYGTKLVCKSCGTPQE